MAVIDRARRLTDAQCRAWIGALPPGAVFSIDRPSTVEEFCAYQELRRCVRVEGACRRQRIEPEAELVAATVEGFRLRVGWLFQGPTFPSSLKVVTHLLTRG
jgi:hypothetical protein